MENGECAQDLNIPPHYNTLGYEPLKEEMDFQNISGQQMHSTVVTIMPEDPPVRDHVIWSIFNTVYGNCFCLGLLALVFSVKSRDSKFRGDKNGAVSYASTARSLNIAATTLLAVFILIIIIVNIAMVL